MVLFQRLAPIYHILSKTFKIIHREIIKTLQGGVFPTIKPNTAHKVNINKTHKVNTHIIADRQIQSDLMYS